MTAQYSRKVQILVADELGNALDLSQFKVKFQTKRAEVQTPASAIIRIYNVAPETIKKIQKEFTRVELQAGYEGNFGLIFSGMMRQKREGRENATDTFLEIVAADGDNAYNYAVINKSIAAGATKRDALDACLEAFAPYDISVGHIPVLDEGTQMPRGQVFFGMAHNTMRQVAQSSNCSWQFNNGRLDMIQIAQPIAGEAIVITANTGMIGAPQQTIDGIELKCLINPMLKFGAQIKLDNASIQQAVISVAYSALNYFPSLDADGNYKIISIENTGDTRGNAWETSLVCISLNGTAPLQGPAINAVASSIGN